MVVEHAILTVKSSETEIFEKAFAQAIRLVASSPGCLNVPCVFDNGTEI
jgi:heme-degrading monooxygenase HmoA